MTIASGWGGPHFAGQSACAGTCIAAGPKPRKQFDQVHPLGKFAKELTRQTMVVHGPTNCIHPWFSFVKRSRFLNFVSIYIYMFPNPSKLAKKSSLFLGEGVGNFQRCTSSRPIRKDHFQPGHHCGRANEADPRGHWCHCQTSNLHQQITTFPPG